MLKTSVSFIFAIALVGAALSTPVFAQLPAASSGASTGAAPVKALSEPERRFVREAGEGILTLQRVAAVTGWNSPASKEVKDFCTKVSGEANKAWGELAAIAMAHKAEMPKTEPSASDVRD